MIRQSHYWIRNTHYIKNSMRALCLLNHRNLTKWLSQPSKSSSENGLNRSATKGYKLAVTCLTNSKTSKNYINYTSESLRLASKVLTASSIIRLPSITKLKNCTQTVANNILANNHLKCI